MNLIKMTLPFKINVFTSAIFLISYTFLSLIKTTTAKQCRYFYENGDIKYFYCRIYEFCCGSTCCRSSAMTFYQMWYFWLMVFLTILFCSGGGWWYRIRNNEFADTRAPQVLSSYYSGTVQPQQYPTAYPTNSVPMQHVSQYQNLPPPPYYGPPPSYEAVMNNPVQMPPTTRQGS